MNDLESKLRDSLDTYIGVPPLREMPPVTRARVNHRRIRSVAGIVTACLVAAVAVVAVFTSLPHGRLTTWPSSHPAAGATPWPNVVVGDPNAAYISPPNRFLVDGSQHVLVSGTVDGSEFSFVGYTGKEDQHPGVGLSPCIEIAGPAIPGKTTLVSPGPVAPGALAATGGVGGFCAPSPSFEQQVGWPLFPAQTDVLLRSFVAGGQGVCRSCEGAPTQPVEMGFATGRVARMEVRLDDGSVYDVPVLEWSNPMQVKGFVFFPPSSYEVGQLLAFDADGHLLARAPLCGPDTGDNHCDMSPTQQVAAMQSATGTTTASPAAVGTISGHLVAVGGLVPGARPLNGSVVITGGGKSRTVTVGADGSFSITVPVGSYTLSGTSPKYDGGRTPCRSNSLVIVQPGASVVAKVSCQEI